MKSREFKLKSPDSTEIHVYEWLPDSLGDIRGILQISHGMAEHAARYNDFAGFLTSNGYAVYANDLRGHGKTAGSLDKVGFIAEKAGWQLLVSDFALLGHYIKDKYNGTPYYIFGHSMGSFVVRNFILNNNTEINGAIVSGTGANPGILGYLGILLSRILMLFYPSDTPSPFMDKLSFGAFNKPFKPNRTKFDWLSRDKDQVDKYVEDPYCGGIFSIRFFYDMVSGLQSISSQKAFNNMSKDLPILIFSGADDSVGNFGKGETLVLQKYKKAGVKDLTFKLYPEGRHEMLNEINYQEVYQLVLDWLNKR